MSSGASFSFRRLSALCRKESLQITRDPGSIIIAVVIPFLLMLIFGYAISFDTANLRVGLVLEDQSPEARRFADAFRSSPWFEVTVSDHRENLVDLMQAGRLRGIIIVPVDFSRRLLALDKTSPIQVITDGSEPNTANFVHAYATGVWQVWEQNGARDAGLEPAPLFAIEARFWFNQDAVSRNYILPGAITIIITVIGAILTSMVIAREWERGTMEALLSTQITRAELLLSKFLPYYLLGMFTLAFCMFLSIVVFRVPFRGSFFLLWLTSTLFFANTLGLGLLVSTVTRVQFNAAQITLNAAFLPAIMLSGFVFEIDSMPAIVRAVTYVVPARYYVNLMHTLFLAGNVPVVLAVNSLFLLATAVLFLGLTVKKTRLRLE